MTFWGGYLERSDRFPATTQKEASETTLSDAERSAHTDHRPYSRLLLWTYELYNGDIDRQGQRYLVTRFKSRRAVCILTKMSSNT